MYRLHFANRRNYVDGNMLSTCLRFQLLIVFFLQNAIVVVNVDAFSVNAAPKSVRSKTNCDTPYNLTIGYLSNIYGRSISKQGLVISGAISYAIDTVNSNASLLGGHRLNLIYNETYGETLWSTKAMLDQWRKNVSAFFGPEDSCSVEATIAASLNLPMISYKCSDSKVSNKQFYSTFARTIPQDTQVVNSLIALLQYYKWVKFSVIYLNTPQNREVIDTLSKKVPSKKMHINSKRSFEDTLYCCEQAKSCCNNPFAKIVEDTYTRTRVWVFFGPKKDLREFMRTLNMRHILDHGEHIVVYIDFESYSPVESRQYISTMDMPESEKKAGLEASRSLLVIVSSPPQEDYSQFEDKVREYNSRQPFSFPSPFEKEGRKKHITIYASYLYDAVMLYAEALASLLKDNICYTNGTEIIKRIIKRKRYKSVTGAWMNIDENGDVEGNYSVLALPKTECHLDQIATYDNNSMKPCAMLPVGGFDYDEHTNETVFRLDKVIHWVGGKPPVDEPPCGFDGSACREAPDKWREIIAGVLAGLFATTSIVALVTYRNWKYEKEIAGLLWQIYLKDLQVYSRNTQISGSKMSLLSQCSQESRFFGQMYTQTATYKGTLVALKELRYTKRSVDLPRETKKEMKLMKEIHHANINPFIGAYIEPNCVFIVTEYCAKGSLQDILENVNLKLDSMFIASLVFDLISAMTYLHESDLKVHGNLKSSNCMVTSRWVLQVTDFGLHQLRCSADLESTSSQSYYHRLLWTAPELLQCPLYKGTQKGDVYAFAIIIHEIFVREGPFSVNSEFCKYSEKDIVQYVKECKDPDDPFRPEVSSLQCQDYIIDVMKECWAQKPDNRPDFRSLRQKLKKLRQGLKPDIMDNMMAMMEKYANNLEELVEERTSQLAEEKKKTEALLHRMLPKSVAAELMKGESVSPEAFDAVTIFFSDIVGFTSMSAESTPMEIVTFLNDLYTLFDSIISNYDVYKVETIGDAYMVVSGLPIVNGDKHASEIASMALELLESVKTFKIRHRENLTLQLRIGIHSGPVVAGVVGTRMPRYCLFGDTVNTASRMESNGEALKIHISEECRAYLDKLGGYHIEERGVVKMKGKGEKKTYWLLKHTNDVPYRRDNFNNNDIIQQPSLFATIGNDIKKSRSPKLAGNLPRRGSSIIFKVPDGNLV